MSEENVLTLRIKVNSRNCPNIHRVLRILTLTIMVNAADLSEISVNHGLLTLIGMVNAPTEGSETSLTTPSAAECNGVPPWDGTGPLFRLQMADLCARVQGKSSICNAC